MCSLTEKPTYCNKPQRYWIVYYCNINSLENITSGKNLEANNRNMKSQGSKKKGKRNEGGKDREYKEIVSDSCVIFKGSI